MVYFVLCVVVVDVVVVVCLRDLITFFMGNRIVFGFSSEADLTIRGISQAL